MLIKQPGQPGSSPEFQNAVQLTLPEVYRLIENNASPELLAQQIIKDFHSPENDVEAVYLGLQELNSRGEGGHAALKALGKGSDLLSSIANTLEQNPNLTGRQLEQLLGINRFGVILDRQELGDQKFMLELYRYGIKKGYVDNNMPFEKFFSKVGAQQFLAQFKSHEPQITGSIETDLLPSASTFGDCEPNYLEVLGPKEILRIRAKIEPHNKPIPGTPYEVCKFDRHDDYHSWCLNLDEKEFAHLQKMLEASHFPLDLFVPNN